MAGSPTPTDEALVAYLDGALSEDDRAAVEDALASVPALQGRLAALDIPLSSVRDGADALLTSAPPLPADLHSAPARGWRLHAGLAAMFLLGLSVGWGLLPPASDDWIDVVANYQSLYVPETLTGPDGGDARQARLATVSEALGLDLSPLLEIGPAANARAQLLGLEGEPLAQIAFLDGSVPIAICITPLPGDDTVIDESERFGMAAASWQQNGYGFLVIGGEDRALIRSLAEQVRNDLS